MGIDPQVKLAFFFFYLSSESAGVFVEFSEASREQHKDYL